MRPLRGLVQRHQFISHNRVAMETSIGPPQVTSMNCLNYKAKQFIVDGYEITSSLEQCLLKLDCGSLSYAMDH